LFPVMDLDRMIDIFQIFFPKSLNKGGYYVSTNDQIGSLFHNLYLLWRKFVKFIYHPVYLSFKVFYYCLFF